MLVEVIKEFPNSTGKKKNHKGKRLRVTADRFNELKKDKLVKPLEEFEIEEDLNKIKDGD